MGIKSSIKKAVTSNSSKYIAKGFVTTEVAETLDGHCVMHIQVEVVKRRQPKRNKITHKAAKFKDAY